MDEKTLLLEKYDWLIKSVASKFYSVSFEDLYQVGAMGLLKAYKNYKDNTTSKFSTYAYDYIFGEMYQLIMNQRMIKTNRETLSLYKEIEKARNYYIAEFLKEPSMSELSSFLEVSESEIYNVITCCQNILSLDAPNEEGLTLKNQLRTEDKLLDDKIMLKELISDLPSPEKEIIVDRYYKDMTQSEIAKKYGLTQVMVSRLESKTLSMMRTNIAA